MISLLFALVAFLVINYLYRDWKQRQARERYYAALRIYGRSGRMADRRHALQLGREHYDEMDDAEQAISNDIGAQRR